MDIPINKYPYTDLHEMNLDYILQQLAELTARVEELEAKVEALEGGV